MKYFLSIIFVVIIFSCSKDENSERNECEVTVFQESEFILTDKFRNELEEVKIKSDLQLKSEWVYFKNDDVSIFTIYDLNIKFQNESIQLNNLVIKIEKGEIVWMEFLNSESTFYCESVSINELNNQIIIECLGRRFSYFWGNSNNKNHLCFNGKIQIRKL